MKTQLLTNNSDLSFTLLFIWTHRKKDFYFILTSFQECNEKTKKKGKKKIFCWKTLFKNHFYILISWKSSFAIIFENVNRKFLSSYFLLDPQFLLKSSYYSWTSLFSGRGSLFCPRHAWAGLCGPIATFQRNIFECHHISKRFMSGPFFWGVKHFCGKTESWFLSSLEKICSWLDPVFNWIEQNGEICKNDHVHGD